MQLLFPPTSIRLGLTLLQLFYTICMFIKKNSSVIFQTLIFKTVTFDTKLLIIKISRKQILEQNTWTLIWLEFSYSYQSSPMEGYIWKWLKKIIEVVVLLDLYLYAHICYESYKKNSTWCQSENFSVRMRSDYYHTFQCTKRVKINLLIHLQKFKKQHFQVVPTHI